VISFVVVPYQYKICLLLLDLDMEDVLTELFRVLLSQRTIRCDVQKRDMRPYFTFLCLTDTCKGSGSWPRVFNSTMFTGKRVAGRLRSDDRCSTGPYVLEVHALVLPPLWEENEGNDQFPLVLWSKEEQERARNCLLIWYVVRMSPVAR
jgi:hypothetical protein